LAIFRVGFVAETNGDANCPSAVQGKSPWSGGQGAKPPEADDILTPETPNLTLY